jgi:predicted TIM-barrel fold metal-dependent hydrolase
MSHAGFGDYISADSHVTEPEAAYRDIDPRFRDRAPKLAHLPGMGATIVVDPGGPGEAYCPFGRIATAGRTQFDRPDGWSWDELHPGGYDARARVEEQRADGFAAEVIFPSVGMVLCGHPDRDYQKACFDAYNRWIAEWCATAPDRLLGVGQSAVRSPAEAVQDLVAIDALGLRGVMLPGYPGAEDYHHPMYDPLWEAVVALDLPVSFHILTSGEGRRWRGPGMNGFLGIFHANQDLLGTLIFGGVFDRHPDLRVVCVEADAGWAPHFMFRMDALYERHHKWMGKAALTPEGVGSVHAPLERRPSEYFRENIYVTFQDDEVALRMLDMLNVDRLLWANDHPHSDATWPNSQAMHDRFATLADADQLDRIVRDNAADLYGVGA